MMNNDYDMKLLSLKSLPVSYTYQDLQLTTIDNIFTQIIFDQLPNTTMHLQYDVSNVISQLTNDLTMQTILKAERFTQNYVQKIIDEKIKLLKAREKLENKTDVDHIIMSIKKSPCQYDTKQIVRRSTIITKSFNATFINLQTNNIFYSFIHFIYHLITIYSINLLCKFSLHFDVFHFLQTCINNNALFSFQCI